MLRGMPRSAKVARAPGAHTIAVFAPRGVEHVWVRHAGHEILGHALAEGVVLDPKRKVDGQGASPGPFEIGRSVMAECS
jgi:hypothetical protein